MQAIVHSVHDLKLTLFKRQPPIYHLLATGKVPTSGWKNGRLAPHVYIQPPADGIQGLTFYATAPGSGEVVLPYFSDIQAEIQIPGGIGWLKGFRVHASDGSSAEAFLTDAKSFDDQNALVDGTIPWPWQAA